MGFEEMLTAAGVKIVGPADAQEGFLGSIGVRFMIDGAEAGDRFSLVEHPMSPRALAAPLHRHTREDEYSYVLQGRMGALLGDDVVEAVPGDLVHKPRNQWHTFWNAGDEPCRILEIISPAGFEQFFRELDGLGGAMKADPEEVARVCERYGLEMRPDTVPELVQRFALRVGEPLSGGWVPA
jgi:quercetin dioxygenase-like cupin family protein